MSLTDQLRNGTLVSVAELDFRYGDGDFRLQVPHLAVGRGQKVALIGPSGSGKTTLLRLLAGILLPEAGSIQLAGREINVLEAAERREFRIRRIGLVFEEFELLEYLSVLDNILLPYRLGDVLELSAEVRRRAQELAEVVGIPDKLRRFPKELSQGERQRAAICRAILTGPALVLADEPTGNLDPANKQRVLDIVFEYCTRSGATLITVTHDHDVLHLFDRVIDIKDVRLPAHGASSLKRAVVPEAGA